MITEKQMIEIRDYLKKSDNPLFFFDDDCDGLCSYILLRKYINDGGYGVIVKSSPVLDIAYIRKVEELSPDLMVVLDKPIIDQEFIDKVNVPLLWIDHHPIINRKGVHYYNPLLNDKKDNRPTSYWAYKIAEKQNLWVAMCGIIADWYVPEFTPKFSEKYPDLLKKGINEPGKIIYETNFGELIRILSFLLKGKTSDVKKSISIFNRIENPYEILNQNTPRGKFLFKRAEKIKKAYNILLDKALKSIKKDKLFVFTYPDSKTSFTGDLSNELIYRFPDKVILVGRQKEKEVACSIRSSKILLKKILENALVGIKGYGGGHDLAVGSYIAKEDFPRFIENIRKQL